MFQRHITPQSRRLAALGVAGAVILAACGSDGNDGDETPDPAPAESTSEDEAMEDDEDAMDDDAMDDDAMDDDAMADEAMDDEAMDDEDAMEDEAMDDDAMEDEAMDDEDAMDDDAMDEDAMAEGALAVLEFDGLPVLGEASVYEGWLIVDGAPVTTGRFVAQVDGTLVDDDGDVVDHFAIDDTAAEAFVLTIEPVDDPDPAPSDIHLLGGDVVDGVAALTIDHPTAIGTDFLDAAGSVEVVAPTADGAPGTETAGIWFFQDGAGSLTLPELPAGWVYEGWAVFDGIPVTTGRFTDPNMADDFNGFSGDGSGPATPGEDFIRNAPEGLEFPRSAAGATVVVSVEPVDDDSPAPFVLKPLTGEIPDPVERLSSHPLTNTGDETYPTGTATLVEG